MINNKNPSSDEENKPKYDGFGLMADEFDDVEYLIKKLVAAFKIPREFMGYSK